jgi:hypothetical protein
MIHHAHSRPTPRDTKEALLKKILRLREITDQQIADAQQLVRVAGNKPLKLASHAITTQRSRHASRIDLSNHTPINQPSPPKG